MVDLLERLATGGIQVVFVEPTADTTPLPRSDSDANEPLTRAATPHQ
jgi:hypothetical protein